MPEEPIRPRITSSTIIRAEEAINRLSNARNAQEIAASQLDLLNRYYQETLEQANKSFRVAFVGSIFGLSIFVMAVLLFFIQGWELAIIATIGGAITQFISGILFVLHNRTTRHMASYREPLETMSYYLVAGNMCNELPDDMRSQVRADLIRKMVGIDPLLYPTTTALAEEKPDNSKPSPTIERNEEDT